MAFTALLRRAEPFQVAFTVAPLARYRDANCPGSDHEKRPPVTAVGAPPFLCVATTVVLTVCYRQPPSCQVTASVGLTSVTSRVILFQEHRGWYSLARRRCGASLDTGDAFAVGLDPLIAGAS
jgi:uncharacterized membrane protein